MREAIQEMLQSRSEHARKTDPLVGAIVVNASGKILAEHIGESMVVEITGNLRCLKNPSRFQKKQLVMISSK